MTHNEIDAKILHMLKNKRDIGKSIALGAAYGTQPKRKWDMRQIGGSVTISTKNYVTTRKLFMKRNEPTSVIYVKDVSMRFAPLCVDGTTGEQRWWSDLKLPKNFTRKYTPLAEGGHIMVHDIVLMAKYRVTA